MATTVQRERVDRKGLEAAVAALDTPGSLADLEEVALARLIVGAMRAARKIEEVDDEDPEFHCRPDYFAIAATALYWSLQAEANDVDDLGECDPHAAGAGPFLAFARVAVLMMAINNLALVEDADGFGEWFPFLEDAPRVLRSLRPPKPEAAAPMMMACDAPTIRRGEVPS